MADRKHKFASVARVRVSRIGKQISHNPNAIIILKTLVALQNTYRPTDFGS